MASRHSWPPPNYAQATASRLPQGCFERGAAVSVNKQRGRRGGARGSRGARAAGMHPQVSAAAAAMNSLAGKMQGEWPPGGATHQQQLSVVTTVWGVTTSTQSGPQASFATGAPGPGGFVSQSSTLSGPGNPGNKQGFPGPYHHRQQPTNNGYPGSGPGEGPQYGQSQALSAAAMVAAATATATATASVVALQQHEQRQDMNQQQFGQMMHGGMQGGPSQQQQQQQQQQSQYGHHQYSHGRGHMGGVGMGLGSPASGSPGPNMMQMQQQQSMQANNGLMSGGSPAMAGMNKMTVQSGPGSMYPGNSRGRMAPYPTPGMHMSQKRQQQQQQQQQQMTSQSPYPSPAGPGFNPAAAPQYPGQYGGRGFPQGQPQQQPPPSQQYLQQQQSMGQQSFSMQQMRGSGMRQATPPYPGTQYFNPQQQQFSPQQASSVVPPPQYGQQYGSSQQQFQQSIASYQHSPIPGNPTPPLTPASSLPPYISPNNQDIKPNFGSSAAGGPPVDMKPPLPMHRDEELRLTFPVRDGIILPPFRLEHNLAVSNHVFQLKPTVHQTLMWRSDLELQLKCFHHEDRQMNTNWPASVQVSVNATPLNIDRGENKTSHKPLYLKEVCQPGRNTIQITVSACCCSHLFVLQLVHRPSVRSVLQGLLRKRLLTADHCISKIKRNFSNTGSSSSSLGATERDSGVEQTALKVSLKCPITFKKITLPARGHDCKHIQCFDLESYLQLNCERGSWRCPVCNKPAQLEGLEVDQYMWAILGKLTNTDVEEVTIDAAANWKPAKSLQGNIKSESSEMEECSSSKRLKAMSPGSMTMPTMSNWDMSQSMSPYIPPDMNSIASGSMMNNGPPPYGMQQSQRSSGGPYDFGSPSEYSSSGGGPLSHLSDSVNSLDPLNAMEKTLNEQMPHTPHTPHTPGGIAHTPGQAHTPGGGNSGPPSVPPPSVGDNNNTSTGPGSGGNPSVSAAPDSVPPPVTSPAAPEIPSDLNFDPAAVIDGEGQGQEGLNLLPDNVVDPMELLSYLDPPDLATPPSSGASSTGATPGGGVSSSDDILALFE